MPTHRVCAYRHTRILFCPVEICFCDIPSPPTHAPPQLAHLLIIPVYSLPIDLLCVHFGTHSLASVQFLSRPLSFPASLPLPPLHNSLENLLNYTLFIINVHYEKSSQLQKCMVIKSSPYKDRHLLFPHPSLTLPPQTSALHRTALRKAKCSVDLHLSTWCCCKHDGDLHKTL